MRDGPLIVCIVAGCSIMLTVSAQAPPASWQTRGGILPEVPGVEVDGPCLPLDCATVSVAPPPGFDYPDPAAFVPDRRPGINVGVFGGICAYPPIGLPDWWLDLGDLDTNGIVNSVDELLERYDEAYEDGWRRIITTLPAGTHGGLMASSQWWTMPQEQRDSLTLALPAWLAGHPDATLGVYMGFLIADPCLLCMHGCTICFECVEGGEPCDYCPECAGTPSANMPYTTNPQDMCVVRQNIEPWIDAGLYEIWFDHSGGTNPLIYEALLHLAGNPDYSGRIRMVSEPIINDGAGGGTSAPIMDAVNRMPFASLRPYYESHSWNAPAADWIFDPATTEVHAMFRPDSFCVDQVPGDGDPCTDCPNWCEGAPEQASIDIIYDYMQRGYVPLALGATMAELVRRIRDQNVETIDCPMDLDGDGDIDGNDADRAAVNMGMATGATLYHGDVDYDDDVDVIDYFTIVAQPGFPGPCP